MSRKPRCKERWICQTKNTNEEASQGLVRLLVLICSHQSLVSEEDYQSYELNLTSSKESDQTMLVHFFLQKTEQRANHPHYSFCQLKSILQNSLHLRLSEKNNTNSDYKKIINIATLGNKYQELYHFNQCMPPSPLCKFLIEYVNMIFCSCHFVSESSK